MDRINHWAAIAAFFALGFVASGAIAADRYVPRTARGQAVQIFLERWAPTVSRVYGTRPGAWASSMAPTFRNADVDTLRRSAQARTYTDAMQILATPRGVAGAAQGVAPMPDGVTPAATGLVYTVLTPCRLVDTRNVARPLAAGETRTFQASLYPPSNQGGSSSSCGVPANASAVTLNVTVVYPSAPGYLTVFPSNRNAPLASSLNYGAGAIVGNEILAPLATSSDGFYAYFSLYSFAAADVVVDVAGYFSAPSAAALDCRQVASSNTSLASGASGIAATPVCAAGYTITGGGCFSSAYPSSTGVYFYDFGVDASNRYVCSGRNQQVNTVTIGAQGICCRVPGN